jgi:hypothetical protein
VVSFSTRVSHSSKCFSGVPSPSYLRCLLFFYSVPNLMCSNRLHWYRFVIVSLCEPHHIASVALSASSLWFSNTSSSYCVKNVSKSISPWKQCGSLISIPIHRTVQSILAHFFVDTSCSLCCHFSNLVSESVAHQVILHLFSP